MYSSAFFFLLIITSYFGSTQLKEAKWKRHLINLATSTPDEVQANTVRNMLQRLLPNDYSKFDISVDSNFKKRSKDSFKVSSPKAANDSRVFISGTSGVAAALGILHYLKYFCNSHVSWEANQLHIPTSLPSCQVKIEVLDLFRYYQNVCTSSYSFAWWNWEKWERHIDWMALNGINFPLAFTAQEAIWRRVYLKLNFTQEDLDQHFVGPAFLAWGRMGNIKEWKGPLSESWHQQTLILQHKILKRMRDFGMIPILPAFAGHVPPAVTRIYPTANVTRLSAWAGFTSDNLTRTYLLSPTDPLFSRIGSEFINEMTKEFNGTDHVYNCDPFNEMDPTSNSPVYLRSISKAIFKAMKNADKKAVWVLQGWMFHDGFWTHDAAKSFITAVPRGRMIVLDLNAEVAPLNEYFDSFFGQPFIFCLLSNYGGVNGLFGNVQVLSENLQKARSHSNSSLVGTGLTPEGINQNYILYDLMLEMSWRQPLQVNLSEWAAEYASRRYGTNSLKPQQAWQILMRSVYNCTTPFRHHGQGNLIQHRPNLNRKNYLWYEKSDVIKAWDLLVESIEPEYSVEDWINEVNYSNFRNMSTKANNYFDDNSTFLLQETFRHDLVDVTRQVLQIIGSDLVLKMRQNYRMKSQMDLNATGSLLEELLEDLDYLLGTSKDFLLGSWLLDASNLATTEEERNHYVSNALYQISLWGPNGEILDYAVKQWNGVVKMYFKPRWSLFKNVLLDCLQTGVKFQQKIFDKQVFIMAEKPFADGNFTIFETNASGDVLNVVKSLYQKYRQFWSEITKET